MESNITWTITVLSWSTTVFCVLNKIKSSFFCNIKLAQCSSLCCGFPFKKCYFRKTIICKHLIHNKRLIRTYYFYKKGIFHNPQSIIDFNILRILQIFHFVTVDYKCSRSIIFYWGFHYLLFRKNKIYLIQKLIKL